MLNSISNKYLLNFNGNNQNRKKDFDFNNKKNQNLMSDCRSSANLPKISFGGCYRTYEDLMTGIKVIPVFEHIDIKQFFRIMLSSISSSGKSILQMFDTTGIPDINRVNFNKFAKVIKEFVNSAVILGEGESGHVFSLDDNRVLKIFREARESNGEKETKVWDSFYKDGIDVSGLPFAQTAFEIPGGSYLLISKKIPGAKPSADNKFNEKNLKDLMSKIYLLDLPEIFIDDDNIFSYGVRMHNDLHRNNINITDEKGGILDFEFLRYEYSNLAALENIPVIEDLNILLSDTCLLPSNLKTFELRTFVPYLFELFSSERNPSEIKNIFEKYLELKAAYHKAISNHLIKQRITHNPGISNQNSNIKNFIKLRSDLIHSEYAHFRALYDNNPDVITAEAIKMQLSYFIYMTRLICKNSKIKINFEQIKDYIENAEKFFTVMKKNSLYGTYWNDCIKFIENCKKLYEDFKYPDTPFDCDEITVLSGIRANKKKMSLEELKSIASQQCSDKSKIKIKVRFMPEGQPDFCLNTSLKKLLRHIRFYEMLQTKKTDKKSLTLTKILGFPKDFKSLGM